LLVKNFLFNIGKPIDFVNDGSLVRYNFNFFF
jgi:hypothetical protein